MIKNYSTPLFIFCLILVSFTQWWNASEKIIHLENEIIKLKTSQKQEHKVLAENFEQQKDQNGQNVQTLYTEIETLKRDLDVMNKKSSENSNNLDNEPVADEAEEQKEEQQEEHEEIEKEEHQEEHEEIEKGEQQEEHKEIEKEKEQEEKHEEDEQELQSEIENPAEENEPQAAEEEDKQAIGDTENLKIAYLTFDDGPSKNTVEVLKILKNYNVKATFFVNGNRSQFGLDMYKQIVKDGHVIANHTYSHDYSSLYKSVDAFLADFYKLENLIYETIGIRPDVMRFPGGSNNTVSKKYGGTLIMDMIIKEMKKRNYIYFDWNVDSQDASGYRPPKSKIVSSVLNGSKGKQHAIILMHDAAAKTTTVDALPEIIEGLKKQGFVFKVITRDSYNRQFK